MSKLIIEKQISNGVPFNEYYMEGESYLGVVFIQHGFQSNKNRGADYLAINLARQNYLVVAIDAYKHGDRIEEPFISGAEYKMYADAFVVVNQTSDDIISLFESRYKDSYSTFDMIGISMGGFIAYTVSLKCTYVNRLIPVISTPDFIKLASTRSTVQGVDEYRDEVEKHMELIKSIDPVTQVEKLNYKSMFLLSCSEDPIIDYHPSEDFYKKHKKDNVSFELYEDVHTVNRKMQVDILEYIANKKVVL